MNPLPITAQQIVRVVLIFVGVIIGFGVLSGTIGWPDKQNWGLVVLAALAIALLPIIGPLLAYLQESGAVIDIRGVKFDFSRAPRSMGIEPRRVNLDESSGLQVTDSNASSIAEVAAAALDAKIVVVNLGTGRSWYPSRLFALAAAADTLNGTEAIVLLAQHGGIDRHWIGWLRPRDVIRGMIENEPRYDRALKRAKAILEHLRLRMAFPGYNVPPLFNFVDQLHTAYLNNGDLAFVPALIHELQQPLTLGPPNVPSPGSSAIIIEDHQTPRWLTREEADRIFDPWLIRDSIRVDGSENETMVTLARIPHRFIAMVEEGRYVGMVDIDAYIRRLVLQPTKAAKVV